MNERHSLDRHVPRYLSDEIATLEKCGLSSISVGELGKSIDCYSKMLQLLYGGQVKEERPIHKGVPYHMLGLAYLYEEKADESIWNLLLAYIEDTLNTNEGAEQEADRAPAARLLTQVFDIDIVYLQRIKDSVRGVKSRGQWAKATDPSEILLETNPGFTKEDFRSWYKSADVSSRIADLARKKKLEFKWEKRVFVGGNYYECLGTLRKIAEIIKARKQTPVLALDYRIPDEELISHHSLMLLHTCHLAIFELSVAGGQYFEIARVNEYEIPTLGLYHQDSPYWKSSMLVTMGGRIAFRPYGSHSELEQRVRFFLDNPEVI